MPSEPLPYPWRRKCTTHTSSVLMVYRRHVRGLPPRMANSHSVARRTSRHKLCATSAFKRLLRSWLKRGWLRSVTTRMRLIVATTGTRSHDQSCPCAVVVVARTATRKPPPPMTRSLTRTTSAPGAFAHRWSSSTSNWQT